MDWFALTLVSVLIYSLSSIFQRVLMRGSQSDPAAYSVVFALFLSFTNFVVTLFLGFNLPKLDWNLIYFLLSAVLWGLGTVFLFKAMKVIEASEVAILISLRVLVTIIASIFFLGEVFNFQKLAGTMILLLSIFLVANIKKGIMFNQGIFYSAVVTFFYGLATVVDAFVLRGYDVFSYVLLINFLIFWVLLIIFPRSVLKWREFAKRGFLKKMIPLSILSSLQAYAYLFAIQRGPLVQIAPINQTQVIVTVLFAVVLLKERDNLLRKIVAAVLVVFGVYLLK